MDKTIKDLLKKLSQAEEALFKSFLPTDAQRKTMIEKRDALRAEVDRYSQMIWEVSDYMKSNMETFGFE